MGLPTTVRGVFRVGHPPPQGPDGAAASTLAPGGGGARAPLAAQSPRGLGPRPEREAETQVPRSDSSVWTTSGATAS